MTRRFLRAALAGALLSLVLLSGAGPAFAHAVLLGSTPGDQQVLDASPATVELRFNEAVGVEADGIQVLDASGARVDTGAPSSDSRGLTIVGALEPDLADGSYIVSWRVVSGDGHPIRGAFVFSVGEPGATATALADGAGGGQRGPAETVLVGSYRSVLMLATLLAAGGLLFLGLVHDGRGSERRRLGRLVAGFALVAAIATLVGIGLQSLQLHGTPGAALSGLPSVIASSYGASAGLRLAGLVAVATAALWGARADDADHPAALPAPVAVTAALATVGSFALTGHSVLSEPRWLATAANVGHTFTGAAWLGGLVLLALCLRARRGAGDALGAGRIVARFSRMAVGTMVLLALAGGTLAWVQVRTTGALFATDYGRTLLVKLGLVAAVGLVAVYNHRRLVPGLRRTDGNAAALARLRSTVRLEVVGLVATIAVTSVLVDFTPAARALAEPTSQLVQLDDDTAVELTVENARPGMAELHIYLLDGLGRPQDGAQEITLRFSSADAGIAPISRTPNRAGPGHWQHRADAMSVAGTWQVEVQIRLSDFDQRTTTFDLPIT